MKQSALKSCLGYAVGQCSKQPINPCKIFGTIVTSVCIFVIDDHMWIIWRSMKRCCDDLMNANSTIEHITCFIVFGPKGPYTVKFGGAAIFFGMPVYCTVISNGIMAFFEIAFSNLAVLR